MERLTVRKVDEIISTRVQRVEFRSPMSCSGKCCPIPGTDQFFIFVEGGIYHKDEQMLILIHEISHIHFGVVSKGEMVLSSVPDSVVEDEALRFVRENPSYVNSLYERLRNQVQT